MLLKFLAKRTVIAGVFAAVLVTLIKGFDARILVGICVGGILFLLRMRSMRNLLTCISAGKSKSPVLFQCLSLLSTLAVLIAAAITDINLFYGVVAGLLLVPLVICANAVTEMTGITKNGWGEQEVSGEWST